MKDQFSLSSYLYDAGPNRVWQITGEVDRMWINGSNYIDRATLDNATVYTSPHVTINGHEYTKHYFMGGERIASNFGSGFGNALVSPSSNQNLIPSTQETVSDLAVPMLQKLHRDWECVGITSEYVEWNTDISVFDDLDNLENENTVYFFLTSHLGSTSWILTGSTPIQHLQYLPFGEDYISEQNVNSTFNTNFTFSGKERDVATGYSYFGFRYYDASTSIWLIVDLLSDVYTCLSSYTFVAKNPNFFIDPDGRSEDNRAFVLINRNAGQNDQFRSDGILRTYPCESCIWFHEVLDHGLDYIRTGTLNEPTGATQRDNVEYHNRALRNVNRNNRNTTPIERNGQDHIH